jgi:hypothetical protein
MCGRKFFKLLRISTLKFEKLCGKKFFELLKVSILKFEVWKKGFQVAETFKLKVCQKKFFAIVVSFKFAQEFFSNI